MCFTSDRKTVFVYQTITVFISLEAYPIDYREFLTCRSTYLRSNITTQRDIFYTRCQFIYVVIDFRPVECKIPVDILRSDGVEAESEFMRVGMNLSTVGE